MRPNRILDTTATDGHSQIGAVDASSTKHRRKPRTAATVNLVASLSDLDRLDRVNEETPVSLRVTKRGDVRMASWIDPSRIKPKAVGE
jgi:hypothetical protein